MGLKHFLPRLALFEICPACNSMAEKRSSGRFCLRCFYFFGRWLGWVGVGWECSCPTSMQFTWIYFSNVTNQPLFSFPRACRLSCNGDIVSIYQSEAASVSSGHRFEMGKQDDYGQVVPQSNKVALYLSHFDKGWFGYASPLRLTE